MKTAVIYARYSSDSQSEQSIEGQLRICEEYAKHNNILILNTYIDRAMTGKNDHRASFQQMLRDSIKQSWDYVLVYKLDRFSRNKYEIAMHKKTLRDNGVKLLSAMENIPDTPEGIILESLLEGMAEYYSAELAQKVKRSMHETRLKGYFQGGTLPYGYKLDGRKIVIDEDKQEIVKYIFEQYANGVYVRNIITSLTTKGILNKNKPFATNTIYNILRNEKYTGRYVKDNEEFNNMYPQIVSNEVFEKVRSKSRVNHYGKRSVRLVYLLRNKLICGYCGNPISAESGTAKNGEKRNYYKGLGRKKFNNGCEKSTIRKETLESFVVDTIISELQKPQNIDKIVSNLMRVQNNMANLNTTLKILEKEQKQSQNSLNNILSAIEQGVVNNTTNKRMKELEARLEELEKSVLIERSKISIKVSESEMREYFKTALELKPEMLVNYLIREIKIYNDKMEIQFNSPIYRSPDNQGFYFWKNYKLLPQKIQNKTLPKLIKTEIVFYI